ncbi:hypothetical protein CASFOL_030667 [Castilleja foliolosa]|uniref:Pru domain-containing protein n=1 Tax=Castilleja foliolosa TaxID=1961234 RepID=A0ABD3C5Y9_9LAMI
MAFHPLRGVFVEFRAGKMLLDGTRVVPDNRKGLFRMGMGEDKLYHIQWLDRTQDQIFFPGKAVFEKAIQSSERVYILKFLEDDRKFFFWMQEPKADKDAELCNVVNFLLKTPLDVDAIFSRAIDMLNRSMGAEATSDVTSTRPVQQTDLQPIPKSIVSSGVDPDAGDMLTPENVRQRYPQLTSYVPENGEWTTAEFIKVLKNPAYRQELDSFTNDVGTGQVDLTQYLVDPSKKISDNHTVSSLLEALEDYIAECERSAKEGSDSKSQARDGSDEGDMLTPENIRQRYPQLTSYVPENGEWTPAELIKVGQNPAYRQELDSFTNDLRTGRVDLARFHIDPSEISDNYTVSSLVEALEDYIAECERSAKEGSDSKSQARDGSDGSDEGQ